jgi:Effector Associated Constant Component 1
MGGTFPGLRIEISGDLDTDADELDQSLLSLRDELLELDVDAVDRLAGSAVPPGAKGSAELAGTLAVTLSNSAVLVALVGVLQSWIHRGRGRRVAMRLGDDIIEVGETSAEQQAELIEAWLEHHGKR